MSDKIDWTTIVHGTTETQTCASRVDTNFSVTLPVAMNDYTVIACMASAGGGYAGNISYRSCVDKTSTAFNIQVYNTGSSSVSDVSFNYIVIPR